MKRNNLIEAEGKGYTKRIRINGMKCQCVILKTERQPVYGYDETPDGFQLIPKEEQIEF